jgi:hypothetical protein
VADEFAIKYFVGCPCCAVGASTATPSTVEKLAVLVVHRLVLSPTPSNNHSPFSTAKFPSSAQK